MLFNQEVRMATLKIVEFLVEAGRCAPSADNTQPWRFYWDGRRLTLRYDKRRIGSASFPVHHQATLLTMGAVIENVIQAAAAIGLYGDQKVQAPQEEPFEFFRLILDADQQAISIPEDLPLFRRHTNRLPFSRKSLPEKFLEFLHKSSGPVTGMKVFEGAANLNKIAELIREASEVRFQTREIHEWFVRSLRFDKAEVESGDGLDVLTFGLPPGGKALLRFISDWKRMSALNRIKGYKLLAAIEAASIKKAGAVIAITGEPGMEAAVEAGRLMERVWVEANASGLGVQPYYIVSDQIARLTEGNVPEGLVGKVIRLESNARKVLELGDQSLYMLLRVGSPVKEPVRSVRLPLEAVFSVSQQD